MAAEDWKSIIEKLKKVCRQRSILLLRDLEKLEEIISEKERLISKLTSEIEKLKGEESAEAEELKFLFGKYLSLWNNEPPEKWKSPKWRGMLGRHFKRALNILGDEKVVWKEYENFFHLWKTVEENRYDYQTRRKLGKLFYDGSFSNFISKLPLWKQIKDKVFEKGRDYTSIDWDKLI
jgi:hypothetical protein